MMPPPQNVQKTMKFHVLWSNTESGSSNGTGVVSQRVNGTKKYTATNEVTPPPMNATIRLKVSRNTQYFNGAVDLIFVPPDFS